MQEANIAIIGAGVIGLSIAYELSKSHTDIIVIEKNASFGQETSSRNSEVIHTGLYYEPASLKAATCIRGRELLYEFCRHHNLLHKKCGKLVVACNRKEQDKIESIYHNALRCGIGGLRFLNRQDIARLEPDIKAHSGFYAPESGIIDSHGFMNCLYNIARERAVTFAFATEVTAIAAKNGGYEITVQEPSGEAFSFASRYLINAAGLYADRIAVLAGVDVKAWGYDLSYCKGQYFRISQPRRFSISHLVYPPATPVSLGIHITPDLAGGLRLGPDAKYIDTIDYTIDEKEATHFYESVHSFLPALVMSDLIPDTAGVRPKLQKEHEGFRDFIIAEESQKGLPGFIDCLGIESPGLTGSLAIAEMVRALLAYA